MDDVEHHQSPPSPSPAYEEVPLNDPAENTEDSEKSALSVVLLEEPAKAAVEKCVFMLVAQCPGAGKTSLLDAFASVSKSIGDRNMVILSQDNIKHEQGSQNACTILNNQIKAALLDENECSMIFIDKNNHTIAIRERTFSNYDRHENETVYIVFSHPRGKEAFRTKAYANIGGPTGGRTNHPTLTRENALPVIIKFSSEYQPLTDAERVGCKVISIDISTKRDDMLKSLCRQMLALKKIRRMPTEIEISGAIKNTK